MIRLGVSGSYIQLLSLLFSETVCGHKMQTRLLLGLLERVDQRKCAYFRWPLIGRGSQR